MIKRIISILFSLGLIFSMVSLSGGFDNNKENYDKNKGEWTPYTQENINSGKLKGGHDTITAEGLLIKKEVHKGEKPFEDFAGIAFPSFRIGAHDEDTNKWLNWNLKDPPIGSTGWGDFFDHFYNYKNKKGFKGWGTPAPKRAKNYIQEIKKITGCTPGGIDGLSGENRRKIYEYFGKSLHLLQDMAVPSHTKDDAHPFRKPFENYVGDNWGSIVNSQTFKEGVTADKYLSGNYKFTDIYQYWDSLAKISSTYTSEEKLYELVHDPITGIDYYKLNEEKLKNNVDRLVPEEDLHTAGYIDAIYDYMTGKTSEEAECALHYHFLGPGGDTPDDRFDVSDEFYWEKEYGFSRADLTELYLKTAIKKGKIGVWYWKQYMELYMTAVTQYSDAPQETKDAIEANLQEIGRKLEQRDSEIDGKGAPDIALFSYGFYNPAISLMLKFKEPVAFMGLDFDPSIVKDHPIMIVPSGGFYGLENSEILRAKLEEYVKNGGTLIVSAQQHGYEFSVLPVPQEADGTYKSIKGYGWTEDQSCQSNTTYIDTYHQILSGQSRSTPSLNVDGFFTNYPSNSTVLLRRTVNSQPAMVMYGYGQGKVIVASMYSDWAYSHSQASKEEIALIRDMISWAKEPEQLPEIKQGETVSVTVAVMNSTTTDASSIKLLIYYPDRKNVLTDQTITTSIFAGQSTTISISYASASTSALGIYHIDYELYDAQGNIIQPQAETDSGRFVVSNPPSNPYKSPDFNFAVNSDSEYYVYGSDAVFTVTIWNNSDTDKTVTAKYCMPHHYLETGAPQYRGWIYKPELLLTETLLIPANGTSSFSHIMIIARASSDRFWAYFYNEDNRNIGVASKGFFVVKPSVEVSLQTDKAFYIKGEAVNFTINLQSKNSISYATILKVKVIDPSNTSIYSDSLPVTLSANGTATQNLSFTLPPTAQNGLYIVSAETFDGNGKKIGGNSAFFEVPSSMLSINSTLPATFAPNASFQTSFEVKNIWVIDVSAATLKVDFVGPTGNTLFTNTEQFNITSGQTKTLIYNVPTGPGVFGNYRLKYLLTYAEKVASGEIIIPRSYTIQNAFDKITYSASDTISATISITNTGKFQEDIPLKVEIPEFSYSNTTSLSTLPQQTITQPFLIPVPGNAISGKHTLIVTLGAAYITKTFDFYMPESKLELSAQSGTYSAGDNIPITVSNTGGGCTNYELNATFTDTKGIMVSNQIFTETISAKETKAHNVSIPSGTVSGQYILKLTIKNTTTNKITSLNTTLSVTGISGTLSIRTEKDVYLDTEGVRAITDIASTGMSIPDAELNLKVVLARKR